MLCLYLVPYYISMVMPKFRGMICKIRNCLHEEIWWKKYFLTTNVGGLKCFVKISFLAFLCEIFKLKLLMFILWQTFKECSLLIRCTFINIMQTPREIIERISYVLTLPVRQKVNIFLTKVACKSENKCKNNVSNIDIRGT